MTSLAIAFILLVQIISVTLAVSNFSSSAMPAMQPVQVSTEGQALDTSAVNSTGTSTTDVSNPDPNGDLERPPTITYPDSSATLIVETNQKEKYTLYCRANGNPQPSYRWYRAGSELDERGEYIKAYPDGKLFFKDFSSREDGWYHCKATNRYGTSVSNVFHLVKETDILKFDENLTTTTLKPWQPYSVECINVPVTYPKVRIHWYNAGNNQIRMEDRMELDESGNLHFAFVVKEDHNRMFSCGLTNPQKSTIKVAKMGHLLITDRNIPLTAKRPTIQYITDKIEAIIGKDVILECFVGGVPLANIKWKNSSNHEIIPNQNPRFELLNRNRKLKVRNVKQNDDGTFTCQGSNTAGTVEGQITVNVTSPPMTVDDGALISQTVPDNKVVTLKCKTKAALLQSVNEPMWYRNGGLLTRGNVPDFDRYEFSTDMTELSIRDLDKEKDIANFQCNVTNSVGFQYFDAYLKIIDSIKVNKKPNDVNTIEEDDILDFTVRATGDKCCKINILWYFNSTQIDTNLPPFVLNTTTDSLYFDAGSLSSDELKNKMGTYTCRISDFYQNVSIDVVVRLKEEDKEPERVTAAESNIGLWWVGLLCGLVAISIAVVIILIIVYKRKNPGDTYKLEQQELRHNLNPEEDLLNQSFQDI